MLSILINAYACSPNMGSEPGMAWNWCVNLARYCELHIITEGEFKGIHGRVARIAGQQRVLVELFDGCLVATAYVPKNAMKPYVEH